MKWRKECHRCLGIWEMKRDASLGQRFAPLCAALRRSSSRYMQERCQSTMTDYRDDWLWAGMAERLKRHACVARVMWVRASCLGRVNKSAFFEVLLAIVYTASSCPK